MSTQTPKGLLATKQPDLFFEDNAVGRLKKEIWEASDAQIDAWLAEYGLPAPGCEWAKAGSYIQTTVRHQVEANRRKNDIVLVPVGCTENHGQHMVSAADTLYVSMIAEGVRRSRPSAGPRSTWRYRPSTMAATPTTTWACPGPSFCGKRWCGS
jgi:creatinine amidohydrolase